MKTPQNRASSSREIEIVVQLYPKRSPTELGPLIFHDPATLWGQKPDMTFRGTAQLLGGSLKWTNLHGIKSFLIMREYQNFQLFVRRVENWPLSSRTELTGLLKHVRDLSFLKVGFASCIRTLQETHFAAGQPVVCMQLSNYNVLQQWWQLSVLKIDASTLLFCKGCSAESELCIVGAVHMRINKQHYAQMSLWSR